MPGSGHLQHMPGHTYARDGRWADYASANIGADFTVGTHPSADGAHIADMVAEDHSIAPYAATHNVYAGVHGASTDGQLSLALYGSQELRRMWTGKTGDALGCDMWGSPGMDAGYNIELMTLSRYGMWERLFAADAEDIYSQPSVSTCSLNAALRHHARGLAFAGLGDKASAEAELGEMESLRDIIGLNKVVGYRGNDPGMFTVATLILRARIALVTAAGPRDSSPAAVALSISLLEQAVAEQESWVYSEPPLWHHPVRECLAEVLLHDAADPAGALAVIDPERPVSAWTLRNRAGALRELSMQATATVTPAEADTAEAEATEAWVRADTGAGVPSPLPSSCLMFYAGDVTLGSAASPDSAGGSVVLAFVVILFCAAAVVFRARQRRGKQVTTTKYNALEGEEKEALGPETA